MDAFLDWLRYGLFGREALRIVNDYDADAFQRELSELEVKARFNNLTRRELNNFVYKWDAAVSRHSECWD